MVYQDRLGIDVSKIQQQKGGLFHAASSDGGLTFPHHKIIFPAHLGGSGYSSVKVTMTEVRRLKNGCFHSHLISSHVCPEPVLANHRFDCTKRLKKQPFPHHRIQKRRLASSPSTLTGGRGPPATLRSQQQAASPLRRRPRRPLLL